MSTSMGSDCVDCGEHITETERHAGRSCHRCHGLMHAECAMSTPDENDVCEACHTAHALEYRREMKARGSEA